VSVAKAAVAKQVQAAGTILTTTELRSANKYWHIRRSDEVKIYPSAYVPSVISIMWQTMAQFHTWFGIAPYLSYGIQLLPITAISEQRDELTWSKEAYHSFAESCSSIPDCTNSGWSVLQVALLATVGHSRLASKKAVLIPSSAYDSPGGNGHSLTNLLWYIATRSPLDDPLLLTPSEYDTVNKSNKEIIDCNSPATCTEYVLDTIADTYSCRQRIQHLMNSGRKTELDACIQIAVHEYPDVCGACDPGQSTNETIIASKAAAATTCPPCTEDQCRSNLNRCPAYINTFVCTDGVNFGGCSVVPWATDGSQCSSCCELTDCPKISWQEMKAPIDATIVDTEHTDDCPPCTGIVCQKALKLCPHDGVTPYFCAKGPSENGCSPSPWGIDVQCSKCCKVSIDCTE
jgi:Glycosyl hydrolase family 81 C-terminal domain